MVAIALLGHTRSHEQNGEDFKDALKQKKIKELNIQNLYFLFEITHEKKAMSVDLLWFLFIFYDPE